MKQLEVQIMGQSYMLSCPEKSELRLREAVAKVDLAMCTIRDTGKVKARDRIAVLAALNLTFELLESLSPEAQVAPAPKHATQPPAPDQPPHNTDGQAPHTSLETLLQRLNTALGTSDPRA
jgi:cell division protein ZapA